MVWDQARRGEREKADGSGMDAIYLKRCRIQESQSTLFVAVSKGSIPK
jgi:hypothetical protein